MNPDTTSACADTDARLPSDHLDDLDFDAKDWIMRNVHLNDPVERRRDELRGWAEAAGFVNVEVRNLGDLDGWEMHFNRGTNRECTTAAEAEGWMGYITRGSGCQIDPARFVTIVDGDRIAARFWLQPMPQPAAN